MIMFKIRCNVGLIKNLAYSILAHFYQNLVLGLGYWLEENLWLEQELNLSYAEYIHIDFDLFTSIEVKVQI